MQTMVARILGFAGSGMEQQGSVLTVCPATFCKQFHLVSSLPTKQLAQAPGLPADYSHQYLVSKVRKKDWEGHSQAVSASAPSQRSSQGHRVDLNLAL